MHRPSVTLGYCCTNYLLYGCNTAICMQKLLALLVHCAVSWCSTQRVVEVTPSLNDNPPHLPNICVSLLPGLHYRQWVPYHSTITMTQEHHHSQIGRSMLQDAPEGQEPAARQRIRFLEVRVAMHRGTPI